MKNNLNGWDIFVRVLIIFAALAVVACCLWAFSAQQLTNRESTLLGIFLTLFSLLVGWIITHWYAGKQTAEAVAEVQERSQANLRTYALKASEKVNNLSSELNKLAVYLEDELNYTAYHSQNDELLAKEERLESAIHIIRTLKSVNDTSLSDWQGVIGDELKELREEQAEKEAKFQDLFSRLEGVVEHHNEDIKGSFEHTRQIRNEVEDLRRDLRIALLGISGSTLSSKSVRKARKEAVVVNCPKCASPIHYQQRQGGHKAVGCTVCGTKYISSSSGSGYVLEIREAKKETVRCPDCEANIEILLDNAPGAFLKCKCSKCDHPLRITRSPVNKELVVRSTSQTKEIDEATLEQVRKAMPTQPWPKGTHIAVAQKLNIAPNLVSEAADLLIRRGVFLPQKDGQIIAPIALLPESSPAKEA